MIRGTNLGGWFALERWMTPALFEGISAHDEKEFYQELGFEAAKERLIHHWETFITEEDFAQIAAWHLDAVRLPIPYTVFGDVEGCVGCLPYVDKAFTWAEKYGIKILLDLHTVPGNANGLENGGICGLCTWHLHSENVEKTLDVLKQLVSRYAASPAFWGIQPVNEPAGKEFFKNALDGYREHYAENLAISAPVPSDFLRAFYLRVHRELTPLLMPGQKIVFHDGFRMQEWADFLPREQYPDVLFDTHLYLNFARYTLKNNTCIEYLNYALKCFLPQITEAQKTHDILVGEWTLAHRADELSGMTPEELKTYYELCSGLQELVFGQGAGWFYYSYRVDDPERPAWDLRTVLKNNWMTL